MADDNDLLKEAIANTETEIFSEAVGKDLPSTEGGPGDRSVEEMGEGLEGQHEAGTDEQVDVDAKGEDGKDGDGADDAGKGDEAGQAKDPKTGQFVKKAAAEGEGDGEAAADGDGKTNAADKGKTPPKHVPLSEMLTERKGRQAAEARIKELEGAQKPATAAEIERLVNARVAELLGQGTQKQTTTAEAPPKKDIFDDPDGFIAELTANVERTVTQKFVAADLQRTAEANPEKFEKAYAALTGLDKSDPQARATVKRIWDSATPGADMLKWHAGQEAQREIGGDLEGYKAKVAKETREALAKDPEFRKELLAALQTEARGSEGGTPRHVARMPKSLNGAAGGQSQSGGGTTLDGSDKGVFDSAFQS